LAQVTATKNGASIDILIDKKFFTSYVFSKEEKYPYFFPVNGPTGGSVTSMRNGTYPHHTSLFFGCDKVNGGNYWQEGLDRGQIVPLRTNIVESGGDRVVLEQECIWTRLGAMSPVKDFREITITAPSQDIYQIDFNITLEMLLDVQIEKTNHSLFSARMDPDLAVINGGTMINAEGLKGEKETFGQPSGWIDFYGNRGASIEGLAIMQHPGNAWYPSPWFTRDYGFISPTPMYWPEDESGTSLRKGQKLVLKYRVLIHKGDHLDAEIENAYRIYLEE